MGEELAATRESLAQARRAKYSFDDFVGHSRQITEVKRQAMLAAPLEGQYCCWAKPAVARKCWPMPFMLRHRAPASRWSA
jgi:hypothetical protein